MTKELRKEIMLRSKLKNKFNKERSHNNWRIFMRPRNRCLNILQKNKKEYFNNLNIKQVLDNKLLWKCIKPFFNEKEYSFPKITLVKRNYIVSNDEESANITNDYFINAT